jgi:hypothetical protein
MKGWKPMKNKLYAFLACVLVASTAAQTGRAQTIPRVTIETHTEDALFITSSNNHTWRIGPNSGGGLGFGVYDDTAGATRLRIDLNGNVGIGSTNPQSRLEVAGTIRSTSGGFLFPDGTVQATAAAGGSSGYSAGAGLTLSGNTFSITSAGVSTAMLADGAASSAKIASSAVQTANIADGAVTAQKLSADLVGGVQKVVRGVVVFNGTATDVTQNLPQSIDPTKSYAIVEAVLSGSSGIVPFHMDAALIDLTATSISIGINYPPAPCRVSYQIIQYK